MIIADLIKIFLHLRLSHNLKIVHLAFIRLSNQFNKTVQTHNILIFEVMMLLISQVRELLILC